MIKRTQNVGRANVSKGLEKEVLWAEKMRRKIIRDDAKPRRTF